MIALVIDPGLRHCGASIGDGRDLVWAGLVKSPVLPPVRGPKAWRAMGRAIQEAYPLAIDLLVVELQQDDSREACADDLRELSGVVGVLTGLYDGAEVLGYKPGEWSQVPKHIRHERLNDQLSPEDWAAIESADKDTLDAVSLWLFELKRRGLR